MATEDLFATLPPELVHYTVAYLNNQDLESFGGTCKRNNAIAKKLFANRGDLERLAMYREIYQRGCIRGRPPVMVSPLQYDFSDLRAGMNHGIDDVEAYYRERCGAGCPHRRGEPPLDDCVDEVVNRHGYIVLVPPNLYQEGAGFTEPALIVDAWRATEERIDRMKEIREMTYALAYNHGIVHKYDHDLLEDVQKYQFLKEQGEKYNFWCHKRGTCFSHIRDEKKAEFEAWKAEQDA